MSDGAEAPVGSPSASATPAGAAVGLDPRELAYRIRRHCVLMCGRANASHIGSSLSMADLLAVLYARHLRFDPRRPDWPDRDRFILSKGHGCAALYAVLAECGYFPVEKLETFYQDGSPLAGHATHKDMPGVEVSTGSLGHGLALATGMALAAKRDGSGHRFWVMISDGECDEGSTWEAALFAPQHRLDNLVVLVDANQIQSLGRVEEVIDLEPLPEKWRAFRWGVREVDGHDLAAIEAAFAAVPFEPGRPSCVVARTVKGKGVSYMEDKLLYHYRAPRGEDLDRALAELDAAHAAAAGGAG
jgi:transketolase